MGFQCFLALFRLPEIDCKVFFCIENMLYLLVRDCHLDEQISVHADCHPDERIFGYLLDPLTVGLVWVWVESVSILLPPQFIANVQLCRCFTWDKTGTATKLSQFILLSSVVSVVSVSTEIT